MMNNRKLETDSRYKVNYQVCVNALTFSKTDKNLG